MSLGRIGRGERRVGRKEVSEIVPGWYPDPSGRFEARFHNGQSWTADVSTDGQRFVDPLGTAPPQAGTTPAPTSYKSSTQQRSNKPATAAMVLGIIALAVGWMPFIVVVGGIAAVLALAFGIVGLRNSNTSGIGRSFALTGLITGAVGLAVCVIGVVLSVVVLDAIDSYENPREHSASVTSCDLDGTTATLTGEISNLAEHQADYSIQVAFVRPGTDNAQHSTRISVNKVPPGETVAFEVDREVALDDIDCIIRSVDGPLPFGLEID
jgi:hypothetical protein